MRYYSGYMLNGKRKANFEVRAASKKNALKNLREMNPEFERIVIVSSYKKRG